jgi:hypothetical protein
MAAAAVAVAADTVAPEIAAEATAGIPAGIRRFSDNDYEGGHAVPGVEGTAPQPAKLCV